MKKSFVIISVLLASTSLLNAHFDPETANEEARIKQRIKLEDKIADGKSIKKNFSKLGALNQLIATGDTRFILTYNSLRKQAQSKALVSAIHDNNAVVVAKAAPKVPSILTLEHSRLIRSACQVFMTDEAETTLNNVFTNYAHDLAVQLYGIHGDKFMKYFTPIIIGKVSGVIEGCLLKAVGLKELVGAVKQLSGVEISARSEVSSRAQKLSKPIVDILRLKPLTDLMNRRVIGPYCVGPAMAQAINSLNFGGVIRRQVIELLCNKLIEFEPELRERAKNDIVLLEDQQSLLQQVLARPSNDEVSREIESLSSQIKVLEQQNASEASERSYWGAITHKVWYSSETATNLNAATSRRSKFQLQQKNCADLIEARKAKLVLLPQEIHHLSELLSCQSLVPMENNELEVVLKHLPFVGKHFNRYIQPCPALQPGALSSMVNVDTLGRVPAAYLRLTGVTPAYHELRDAICLDELKRTIAHVGLQVLEIQSRLEDIRNTQHVPTAAELENQGWFGRSLRYATSFVKGGINYVIHGMEIRDHTTEAHETVVEHVNWVQHRLEKLRHSLRIARMPFTLTWGAVKFTATVKAANYVVKFVIGKPMTQNNWMTGFTIAVLEEYHNLFPDHIPSVLELCSRPFKALANYIKK